MTATRIPLDSSFPASYPNYGLTWVVVKSGPKVTTCQLRRADGSVSGSPAQFATADVAERLTPEYAAKIEREREMDRKVTERIAADVAAGVITLEAEPAAPAAEPKAPRYAVTNMSTHGYATELDDLARALRCANRIGGWVIDRETGEMAGGWWNGVWRGAHPLEVERGVPAARAWSHGEVA